MIYITCFLSSVFFAYLASRSKDKGVRVLCSIISIMIPSVVGGLRSYRVGADSYGYGFRLSTQALGSPSLFDFLAASPTEPGCAVLFYLGAHLSGSYTGAFFLFEVITMTCFYIGAYKHRKLIPLPMTMLMFYFILYLRTYNEIRQSIAAAIIFMGVDSLENKNYFKFSIYIAVGTLFHYSAIIAFVLLLGFHVLTTSENYVNNYAYRMTIILGTVVSLLFAFPIMRVILGSLPFTQKYIYYLEHRTGAYNATGKTYIAISLGELLMFAFYRKGAKKVLMGKHDESNVNFYDKMQT